MSLLSQIRASSGALLRAMPRPVLATTSKASYSTSGEERPTPAQSSSLTEIGIRSVFNSDHDILRSSVRKFFDDEIKPYHEQWEKEGMMPKEIFEKAGAAGLICPEIPEEYGGPGGNFLDLAIIIEEQSYANCSGPGWVVQSALTAPYVHAYGTEEVKQKYLPDFVSGKVASCLAMTEPGAGSDLQGVRTIAKRDGDDWVINGSKIFISNGIIADVCVVAAVTDPNAKSQAHGMGLFIVDATTPGYKKGRNLRKLGLKGQDTAELFFEDVRVPSSHVLGHPNKGFHMLMSNLPLERLAVGVGNTAAAEFMFEETRNYVKERKAFGKRVMDFQLTKQKLADMKIQICAARAFTDECIKLYTEKKLSSSMASMAKVLGSDLANKVAYDCLQMHGGYGYMEEYPIARAYRDVRIGPIYAGTNEIMKELIARDIAA